uniref:Cytochrome c oxidase subunit 3 n=1 Tax=Parakontikia atrata TaxID=2903269 RepID=A0A9E7V877_9PLAT|nr:cytochrome c oxidase subunit III [Parakontikia atrata]UZA66412.1 cytochrome c oxidase subunit 3 [Parakontikia atrata]
MFTPFHLVGLSPFPFFVSLLLGSVFFFGVFGLHYNSYFLFFLFFIFFIFVLLLWFGNVEYESSVGSHSSVVSKGLRLGMLLFITSEVLFFFSFFWSYFHNCWSPSVSIGTWPPYGCPSFVLDPFAIPLLNTVYLLSSGVSITACHQIIVNNGKRNWLIVSWYVTVLYGLLFLDFQLEEYMFTSFSINSSVYGSVFFMLTGFHGFHVIIGLLLLFYWFLRLNYTVEFSSEQHVSFEITAWYWHFVDVVWLFLFVVVYWYTSIIP